MLRAAVQRLWVPRDRLGTFSRPKWSSSWGSGFDGSSFSDEEDCPYDEARRMRFGYGEPGSVTLKGNEVDFMIDEFNKELDSLFGAAPPSELESSAVLAREPALERKPVSRGTTDVRDRRGVGTAAREVFPAAEMGADRMGRERSSGASLSHVDSAGKAAMVNIVAKTDTARLAIASCRVLLGSDAFSLVAANSISKGDVLTVAKIAGIMGAKQTASFIPLCHPLLLSGVDLNLTLNEELQAVDIEAKVTTVGPTGVEMEALTAVTVAGLTVYDMCKAVTKDIRISEVRLESKTGGKSGDWSRRRS